MKITYNAPAAARTEVEGTSSATKLTRMYKPLPHQTGKSFTNELYIPLYQPDMWKIFNKTPEEAEALGLVAGNPLAPRQGEDPVYTYHFKIPVHSIDKYEREDGSTGFHTFICPNEFNKYLTQVWGKSKMFKDGSCPFCKARKQAWDDHNERWTQVLEDRGLIEKPKGKAYKSIVDSDPILSETFIAATRTYEVSDKYITQVVDYGRIKGTVQIPEGEDAGYQYWITPTSIVKMLNKFYEKAADKGHLPFFVFDDPEGLRLIEVDKDTTKCSNNNFRDTDYTVTLGDYVQPEEAWKTYMTSLSNMADPSEIISILTAEEMQQYIGGSSSSANVPAQSMNAYIPKQAAVAAPAAPPMVPGMTAPPVAQTAPPVAQTAPPVAQTAPPVAQTAPPVAQTAPPVAQTAPPVAQTAPPMVPSVPGMSADAEPDVFDLPDRGEAGDQPEKW
jgi:hypothetical protein